MAASTSSREKMAERLDAVARCGSETWGGVIVSVI
jgi:hypothetical protein